MWPERLCYVNFPKEESFQLGLVQKLTTIDNTINAIISTTAAINTTSHTNTLLHLPLQPSLLKFTIGNCSSRQIEGYSYVFEHARSSISSDGLTCVFSHWVLREYVGEHLSGQGSKWLIQPMRSDQYRR